MTLDFGQIKEITHGYVRAEEKNGKFCFYRFTPQQTAYYYNDNADFHDKTFATPGVRFDFITDAAEFSFTYDTHSASSRNWYYFDTYIDGVLTDHNGESEAVLRNGTITTRLPDGKHRLTIWFPCLSAAIISNVTISDNSEIIPVTYAKKLLCMGDSITQGYDAFYPSFAYTNALARTFDWDVVNQAIGGEKFVPGLLTEDMDYDPDIVTVAYGTNDWSSFTRDRFLKRCDGFLENVGKLFRNAKIFVMTPIWRGDMDRVTDVGSFSDASEYIAKKARACNLNVIDCFNFTPHFSAFYSDLWLHPNDLGYTEYTKNLVEAIKKKI